MDRAKAVDYAKRFWFRPTDDHLVWLKSEAVDVRTRKTELMARHVVRSDWEPVFLRNVTTDVSTGTSGPADGLYYVAPAHVGVHFRESDIPANERFLALPWFGTAGVPGSPGGLNDCTTYISHCLVAGGVSGLGPAQPGAVWPTRDPAQLYQLKFRPATEVKLIVDMAARSATETVFAALSHVIKPGDVLTFAAGGRQEHAGLLVSVDAATGEARMTCHSTMDHPDLGAGEGTWQIRTVGPEHPFVSLLHFSADDPAPGPLTGLAGWWTVTWLGTDFYYFLTAAGSCFWTATKPASSAAPSRYDGWGHWYAGKRPDTVVIVWTTGTVDEFTLDAAATGFVGTELGEDLIGIKGL
ncbi:amidase domain-containing protein [Kitasatospora sp. NPDC049285]|uniref:amidase domain-containing protein n=1 Tax=Kitasatospora sp. NPDC049285 TaxID=3157096 RepID=UPI0034307369